MAIANATAVALPFICFLLSEDSQLSRGRMSVTGSRDVGMNTFSYKCSVGEYR
jgi:hypothetical protein